jgi:uncharacterized protein YndB with AHSA1/START domain
MPRTFTVSESIEIAADPLTLYAKVSDPTLTRHWSPENRGATMQQTDNANAQVGTVFDGHNERFGFRWTTQCVVTAAEPGERFAFDVRAWGVFKPFIRVSVASWDYTFEAIDGGTRLTETWTDGRRSWPDALTTVVDPLLTGTPSFSVFNRRNIRVTLRNLKSAIENAD